MSWQLWRPALLGLVAASISVSCAEERDPINQVQANALDKAFFVADLGTTADDPAFYTQATLIDVGYGASQDGLFTSTYTQATAIIKWQITEDQLLGRLTYERINNSDGKGAGASSSDGQIVVAYPILSHFDIRHAYNPATGEELNVVHENSSDRPWYERQYFRVDWSKNLNTDAYDFDTLSQLGIWGVDYEPLAYYVSDPNDQDAPFFDVDTGYFDVTNKAFASPGVIDLGHLGWGIDTIPACWLDEDLLHGTFPMGNCNPVELTIRQAFRKVVDTDYEPADWDGLRFQSYGGFYTDRFGYARNFGMSDQQWHRFLVRYNIWERSHYYDDPAAMTGEVACYTPETLNHGENAHVDAQPADGTEDRCWMTTVNLAIKAGDCSSDATQFGNCYAANNWKYGGSRCDTFKQRCTLPYRFRTPKAIAWHYTTGSNQDYFEGTEWATHDHDLGMRHAIQVSRYSECMSTSDPVLPMNDRRGACAAAHPVYFGQMDDHLEAKQLSEEVDNCRHGLSHVGLNAQQNFGAINSPEREAACTGLADTVAAARGAGRTDGLGFGTPAIDPGIVALAKMPEQIVLCHSPVEANDPAVCAPGRNRLPADISARDCDEARTNKGPEDVLETCGAAYNVRIGDLRHHLVNVMKAPQTPSPWGIYTDAEDPLTGEDFSAAINVWSHVNDLFSQSLIDRVRFVKGELTASEITDGKYVKDWGQAAEAANRGGVAPRITKKERNKRIAEFAGITEEGLEEMVPPPDIAQKLRKQREVLRSVRASVDTPSAMGPIYHARRQALQGTELEAQLITPMMQELTGTEGLPSDFATDQASIFRSLNPTFRKEMSNMMQIAHANRGMCELHEAPAPVAITGVADVLERKFSGVCASYAEDGACTLYYGPFGSSGCTSPDDEATCAMEENANLQQARAEMMRKYVAQKAHYAVIVHEMGHSVAMRHNFISSSDAYNYRPQYWQLRTNDGQNANLCTDYDETGSCVGPRYYDPVTDHERDNLIWMWMHSSVMDYAGELTQDFLGLGGYDYAAHGMFYGENVAVFSDPSYAAGTSQRGYGMIDKMDNFGGILGIQPTFNGADIHYSAIQANYGVIYGCEVINDVNVYKPANWDAARWGTWDPMMDGLIVPNEAGDYTKCRQPKVDYVPWQRLRMPGGNEIHANSGEYRGGPSVDPSQRIRVPYGFATDGWADLGNASVYRHDNGADVYEIFNFLATQMELNHIFDSYRRGRQSFSVRAASNRSLGRYNEKIRDGAKGLGLLRKWYQDIWAAEGVAFSSLWGYAANSFFPENLLASGMVFDHFAYTFARPEAGAHLRATDMNGDDILRSDIDSTLNGTPVLNIPTGATGYFGNMAAGGALIENQLCNGCGEFDRDYTMNAGSYYDKVYAPYLMTESVDNFISDSRNDFVDGRYRAVSLADLFPEGYRRWLANNLTGDDFIKGPRIAADTAGNPLVDFTAQPTWPIGYTTWWGDEVRTCFPASGTAICSTYLDQTGGNFDQRAPDSVVAIDPQVGYEQHKFLIAQTMLYLPEDNQQEWLNMFRLYKDGQDPIDQSGPTIELHDPNGVTWVTKTFGTEEIYGKTVQMGVSARMLEYANTLLDGCYVNTPVDTTVPPDGIAEWYEPTFDTNGKPVVKFDDGITWVDPDTGGSGAPPDNCDGNIDLPDVDCLPEDNRFCSKLVQYEQVVEYMYQFTNMVIYGFPDMKGVFN